METRKTLVLKKIARESMDARRLRAALEPSAAVKAAPRARQFTATGTASGKVPPPN